MARMIPPVVPEDWPSEGEREVFRRLRDDPGTVTWTVLHSLGIASHERRVAGEIDFVVIIPGLGVLCLEVKGCSATNLRRVAGLWYYGPRDPGESRGPFRQASEGMHSLRRQLLAARPELDGIQFSSGVVFPYAPFDEESVEWNRWELINSRMLSSAPISRLLTRLMRAARDHLHAATTGPRIDLDGPTAAQSAAIGDALRGNFEIPVDPRARAATLETELRRYTTEQFLALDAMAENPRLVFEGPAGTGKTLLAMEAARRARAKGRHVLLVCFNRLLGSWAEAQTSDLRPEVLTTTLHRQMLAVSGLGNPPENADSAFWETQLPEKACEQLMAICGDGNVGHVFDEMVVDEAQDILREPYLDFLDLSLRGGLASGRWRMFGDFENQSIMGSANLSLDEFRSRLAGGAPLYSLRVNCRNTPLIAEWVHILGGLSPRYRRILRPDDRVNPRMEFYRSDDEQVRKLTDALVELKRLGFRDRDIVILSPRTDHSSAAESLKTSTDTWKTRLRPFSLRADGAIRYGSIYSFKGLEAPAIVVTDIEGIGSPAARSLFYVALTRAVQRLVVLAHERVRREAANILRSPPARDGNEE